MTVRMKQFLRRNTLHFRRQRPVHATRREKSPGYNGSQKRVILAKRFASPTPTELVSTESRVLLSTWGSFPAWIAVASVKYMSVCKVNERKKSNNNKKNRASFTCLFVSLFFSFFSLPSSATLVLFPTESHGLPDGCVLINNGPRAPRDQGDNNPVRRNLTTSAYCPGTTTSGAAASATYRSTSRGRTDGRCVTDMVPKALSSYSLWVSLASQLS